MANMWEGQVAKLRAIESEDLEAFVVNDLDSDAARAGWRVFPPRSSWAAAEWVEEATKVATDGDEFRLAIESVATGQLVGSLNTHRCDPTQGTFSYGVGVFAWAQRQGYGREAIVLLLRYLFGERRYQKCTVGVYGFNEPSVAFHQALGFQVEGRIRRAWFAAGTFHDEILLGITVEEFVSRWGF